MFSWVIQFIYLLGLVIWVGGIIFFSFFTTPMVFTHLPKEVGSRFISAIFPNYYLMAYLCGSLLILTTLVESFLAKQVPWVRLGLVGCMLGLSVYAGTVILPETHQIKVVLKTLEPELQEKSPLKQRFDSLHFRSVLLNIIVLILGLGLIGILAQRLRI